MSNPTELTVEYVEEELDALEIDIEAVSMNLLTVRTGLEDVRRAWKAGKMTNSETVLALEILSERIFEI